MTIVGLRLGEPIKDEENLESPLSWPVAPSYTDKEIQASSSEGDDVPYRVSFSIDSASSLDSNRVAGDNVPALKSASIPIFELAQLIVEPSEKSPQDASVTDHERPALDLDLVVNFVYQPMVMHVSAAATQLPKPARSYKAVLHITRNDE
jgi:hypothetical protein